MSDPSKPRIRLSVIEEKERLKRAAEKLKRYGFLLKKKHHRKEKRKMLREIKKIAIELTEPLKP